MRKDIDIKNKLIEHIDTLNFIDKNLENRCENFIVNLSKYYYKPIINKVMFVKEFKQALNALQYCSKKDFYWEKFKTIVIDNIESRNSLITFVIYVSSTDYLDITLAEEYRFAKEDLLKAVSLRLFIEKSIMKMEFLNSLFIGETQREGKLSKVLFCINVKNTIIHDLLCEFIKSNTEVLSQNKNFFEVFQDSVKDKSKLDKINTFKDFSINIFQEQFKFYDKIGLANVLCSFYLFIWSFEPSFDLFSKSTGITYKALKRKSFFKEYKEGYRLVFYNPLDPVPLFDKWIIDFNGFDNNNLSVNHSNGISEDFNKVENQIYRQYVKTWFWKDSSLSIHAKMSYCFQVYRFFNFLSSMKENNKVDVDTISLEEALFYKNYILSSIESDTNASKYLYNIRAIIRYLKENKLMEIEENVLYHLKYASKSENNSKVVPDEDLNKLAVLMKQNSEISDLNKLYYLLFYLVLETEFRISQILSLEIDCVEETAKPNQYVIVSKTKTSNEYKIPQSITVYTKRQIDHVKEITENLRNECKETTLKKLLFIKRNKSKKQVICPITRENFNEYLSDCCENLGIDHYNVSNLRDTHITKAKELIMRKGLSDIEQSVLTGHTNTNTDNRHYIETKITDMLEIMHGMIIGNIDVNGRVLAYADKSIANEANEVEDGCGYCPVENCKVMSFLACLMCNDFVTVIDRIPYFEEQIKTIDYKLTKTTIEHDKEDLLNIKNLLLNFLKELYMKRDEVMNNG